MIRLPNGFLKPKGRFARRVMERALRNANKDKKKPLGRALDWTDEDLDRLSTVTDGDFDQALAEATPNMRDALESEEGEE